MLLSRPRNVVSLVQFGQETLPIYGNARLGHKVNFAPGKFPLRDKSPENVYIVYKPRRRPNVVLSFLHHSFMSSSTEHSNLSHSMPYPTACLQYSHLTHTPSPLYLQFTRPCTLSSRCPLLVAFLFLSSLAILN